MKITHKNAAAHAAALKAAGWTAVPSARLFLTDGKRVLRGWTTYFGPTLGWRRPTALESAAIDAGLAQEVDIHLRAFQNAENEKEWKVYFSFAGKKPTTPAWL